MISKNDIFDALAAALAAKWPGWDLHRNLCPAEFTRPCFLLEAPRISRRDANAGLIEETAYLTVTCFGEADDYGNSDTGELAQMQANVIDLFRAGYLRVADRAVKFSASEGGMDFDRAWVDLQCRYFEQRGPEPVPPLMREIHMETRA